jgi:hypothetical protein
MENHPLYFRTALQHLPPPAANFLQSCLSDCKVISGLDFAIALCVPGGQMQKPPMLGNEAWEVGEQGIQVTDRANDPLVLDGDMIHLDAVYDRLPGIHQALFSGLKLAHGPALDSLFSFVLGGPPPVADESTRSEWYQGQAQFLLKLLKQHHGAGLQPAGK